MLDGAIKGAAVAGATEFAEAILGKDNIASIAKATGLDKKQVASVFTTSVANGVTAEISGQGEFLETVGISLVAQGVGAKSANLMQTAMKDVLDKDPEIMASVLTATGGIATTAANAALRGEDVGKALENSAPGIILASVQTYQSEADRQDEIKSKRKSAAAQREKELGAVQQPPATGDAVE
jgi:ABC-type Fe3+-citrate transport system substrate-binding protein